MDVYWASYNQNFELIPDAIEINFDSLEEIQKEYYKLFPCDDSGNIPIASLFVLFYHQGQTINELHEYFISILFNDLKFKHVMYLINQFKKEYTCLDNIPVVENYIETHKTELKKEFKGKFKITRQSIVQTKRPSLRERFPKIDEKQRLKIVSHYTSSDYKLLFEAWLSMIKNTYSPLSICIGKDDWKLFTTHRSAPKASKEELMKMEKEKKKIMNERSITNLDPEQALIIPIDEIFECKHNVYLNLLHLLYDNNQTTGHSNAIMVDIKNKIIYRLEPHGVNKFNDKIIEKNLRTYYPQLDDYEYQGTIKTCPYTRKGVQTIEGFLYDVLKLPKDRHGAGFCLIWSMMFLEYIIHYQDTYNEPSEIYNHILSKGDLTNLMYNYTYDLLVEHIKLLDEFDADTSSFIEASYRLNEYEINYFFKSRMFDSNSDEHISRLHELLYNGYIMFDDAMGMYFDTKDNMMMFISRINFVVTLLQSLEDRSLYNKLLSLNNSKKVLFPDDLPKPIEYYKPMIKNGFINILNSHYASTDGEDIKKIYAYFFKEELSS